MDADDRTDGEMTEGMDARAAASAQDQPGGAAPETPGDGPGGRDGRGGRATARIGRVLSGGRRWAALVVLVAVLAGTLWVWWPDGDAPPDTTAFEQAIADLAVAPAVRFENSLGQATMNLEFTANGDGVGSLDLGGLEAELLVLDGRMFMRIPADALPQLPEIGSQVPVVGRWMNLNEEVGAAMRDAMTPASLAVGLSAMLAHGRAQGMSVNTSSVGETQALRARLPAGALYITAAQPHQVLRFDPGGSSEDGAPPPPPPPNLPSLPGPTDDGGDSEAPEPPEAPSGSGGGDLPGEPPGAGDTGLPEPPPGLPSLPPVPTTEELRNIVGAAAVQPTPDPDMGGTLSGIVTSAQVDLGSIPREEVARVYADLQEAAGELEGAVNRDVVLEAQPPVLEPCDNASCQASVDVRVDHANGREVPTGMTVEMTVEGQPAGQCTAEADLPATGSRRLSCTNDNPEWRAARGAGGTADATAEVVPHAMTAADTSRVQDRLARQAENVGFDHIEDATPTEEVDTGVERALEELGLSNPSRRLRSLQRRVGRQADGQAAEDVLTEAHVQDAQNVIAALPLNLLDPESTARVVTRALRASGRRELYRRLNVLRSAAEATEEIREGTRVVLDIGAAPGYHSDGYSSQVVEIGGETFSFASLDLGPNETDRRLDLVYLRPDGTLVVVQVVGAPDELDDRRVREIHRTAVGVPFSGPDREYVLDIRDETAFSEIFRPRSRLAAVPPPRVFDYENLVPRVHWQRPRVREGFATPRQTVYAFAAVLLPNGTVVVPPGNTVHASGGGQDAERKMLEAGDFDNAGDYAAELGTPSEPAQLMVGVSKTPCAKPNDPSAPVGDAEVRIDNSCSTALARERTRLRNKLRRQGRLANVAAKDLLVVRNHYEPNEPTRRPTRTTTNALQVLREAGFEFAVGRVNGAVTARGQWLMETLMNIESTATRGAEPPEAPEPGDTTTPLPASTAPTLANVLDHNGATIRVSGYEFDQPKVRALARAVAASGTPPEQLTSVSQAATTLNALLHQQGVCL